MALAKSFAFMISLLALTACATPQVKTNEQGNFTLFKQSSNCALGEPGGVQSELYFQGEQHCRALGKKIEIVKSEGKAGVPFVRCASAILEFQCVDK